MIKFVRESEVDVRYTYMFNLVNRLQSARS